MALPSPSPSSSSSSPSTGDSKDFTYIRPRKERDGEEDGDITELCYIRIKISDSIVGLDKTKIG